ncbi:MAG: pseudouridine synthase [Limisphaerales bacterium]
MIIAFHKPFGVLSQFTSEGSRDRTLADYQFPKNVWPLGRLDADSEGLLLLSDEPGLNQKLLHPSRGHPREYWAQVERIPSLEKLRTLAAGVTVQGRKTLPCRAWMIEPQPVAADANRPADLFANPPVIPPRNPPVRFRKSVGDCWIGLELIEGKNRQVRKMTAGVGHPTLRLIRVRIGGLWLGDLKPGQWRPVSSRSVPP